MQRPHWHRLQKKHGHLHAALRQGAKTRGGRRGKPPNLPVWETARDGAVSGMPRGLEQLGTLPRPSPLLKRGGAHSEGLQDKKPPRMGWRGLDLFLLALVENVACLRHTLKSFNEI